MSEMERLQQNVDLLARIVMALVDTADENQREAALLAIRTKATVRNTQPLWNGNPLDLLNMLKN